jgi:hypothetical protein
MYLSSGTFVGSEDTLGACFVIDSLDTKIMVVGSGMWTTTLTMAASQDDDVLKYWKSSRVAIRDLSIDGNMANQAGGSSIGLGFHFTDSVLVENINIVNVEDHLIAIYSSEFGVIEKVFGDGGGTGGSHGIDIDRVTGSGLTDFTRYWFISECIISNVEFTTYKVENCQDIWIDHSSGYGTEPDDISKNNFHIGNNDATPVPIKNITLTDCYAYGGTDALRFDECDSNIVVNSFTADSGKIKIEASAADIRLISPTINVERGDASAIQQVAGHSRDIEIINATIYGHGSVADAIKLEGSGEALIVNTEIHSVGQTGIHLAASLSRPEVRGYRHRTNRGHGNGEMAIENYADSARFIDITVQDAKRAIRNYASHVVVKGLRAFDSQGIGSDTGYVEYTGADSNRVMHGEFNDLSQEIVLVGANSKKLDNWGELNATGRNIWDFVLEPQSQFNVRGYADFDSSIVVGTGSDDTLHFNTAVNLTTNPSNQNFIIEVTDGSLGYIQLKPSNDAGDYVQVKSINDTTWIDPVGLPSIGVEGNLMLKDTTQSFGTGEKPTGAIIVYEWNDTSSWPNAGASTGIIVAKNDSLYYIYAVGAGYNIRTGEAISF